MEELSSVQKQIRDVLICRAQNRRTITYAKLGCKTGRPTRWRLWKDNLDAIMRYEKANRRPDLTLVVVLKNSGLPRVYKGEKMERSRYEHANEYEERVKEYKNDLESVFREWSKAR